MLTITDNAGLVVSDIVGRAVTSGTEIVAAQGSARVFMDQPAAEAVQFLISTQPA